MDPNDTAIPAWRNPRQKTRTVKRWRPSDLQLQYLWEIYDEETDTPSKDRREQIIAHLKEDRRSERQKCIDSLRNHKPATDFIITDADVQSWFQNRKRENSIKRGDGIKPSLSCEDGEAVTSWRPNEEQLEVLWYVYDHGNCTPPLARRKVIVEALRQAQRQPATDSRKENRDKLEEHRPATFTISDRNVKSWLDNRYRDKQLREKRILHSMVSSNDGESDFSPRNEGTGGGILQSIATEAELLGTQPQVLRQLRYDEGNGTPDKTLLKEIIATCENRDRPIAVTNELLRSLIVADSVGISTVREVMIGDRAVRLKLLRFPPPPRSDARFGELEHVEQLQNLGRKLCKQAVRALRGEGGRVQLWSIYVLGSMHLRATVL